MQTTTATSSMNLPDLVVKLIIIGDTNCGKSAILHQFIEGVFKEGPPKHTIGVEFASRVVPLAGKKVKIHIWDTAGQERFRSVTHSYYRGALGALLVYDIAHRSTFDSLQSWLSDVRSLAGPDISIVLCGNKTDLPEEDRQVSLLEGSRFAQENDCMFLETSALDGANVEEAFLKCTKTILNKIELGILDPDAINTHQSTPGGVRNRQGRSTPGNTLDVPEDKAKQSRSCCYS